MTTKTNGKTKSGNKRRDRTLHLSVPLDILKQISLQAAKERRTLHGHTLVLVEEALLARESYYRKNGIKA